MRGALLAALVLASGPAAAQSYGFEIPEAEVTVTIGSDGSAIVHYAITFRCNENARSIDVVDIGMPGMSEHEAISASVDGEPLPEGSIRISTYLEPKGSGYEIDLGDHSIDPGETSVLEFTGGERRMVWQDTTDPLLASFRFAPTWFGSEFVSGETKLLLRYRLPIPAADYASVKDRILWQREGEEFDAKGVMEGEDVVSVGWARTLLLTGPHLFSVSFPKSYVTEVRRDTVAAAFMRWFEASPAGRIALGAVLIAILGAVFFTVTRGTGWSLFILVAGMAAVVMYASPVAHLVLFPVVIGLGGLVLGLALRRRSRKPAYFAAEMCMEGGGIRRGLTAVEAAVLLAVPVPRILTMLVFGLARKGVVAVRGHDPLLLEVVGKEAKGGPWEMPGGRAIALRPYEPAFLAAFRGQKDLGVEHMNLADPFAKLVDGTADAMAGFDLPGTRSYYERIVARAWDQVKAGQGDEVREARIDRDIEWLVMDEGWEGRARGVPAVRSFRPAWWYGPAPAAQAAPGPQITTLADVARGLTGRLENASKAAIGSLDGLGAASGKGVDLSGVDTFTKDMLSALFSSRAGSGGARSGGCACACAGCACACACAGGGR